MKKQQNWILLMARKFPNSQTWALALPMTCFPEWSRAAHLATRFLTSWSEARSTVDVCPPCANHVGSSHTYQEHCISAILDSRLLDKKNCKFLFSSVQFSRSVMSDSLRPHELQHARPPCPSPTPRVHPNSCPLSRWCHPAISSSVVPFSSCPQSLPA